MPHLSLTLTRKLILLASFANLILIGANSAFSQTSQFPGGFVEHDDAAPRTRWTNSQVQSFIPAGRVKFTFPAPYNTEAFRITLPSDCGNLDCVWYLGYSYWRNTNYHVNSSVMKIFVGLNTNKGGTGPTLFQLDKTTDTLTMVGPLFPAGSSWRNWTGEGWYWSGSQENILYVNDTKKLYRYDVAAQTFTLVLDVQQLFGMDRGLWQSHASNDDNHHTFTLTQPSTGAYLGCVYYNEAASPPMVRFYPKVGTFDECNLDKSGRWTVSLEDIGVANDLANRIFDNSTGQETLLSGPYSTLGHMDLGYGYMVGADNYNTLPNAGILWNLQPSINLGPIVHYNYNWNMNQANHITHTNAKSNTTPTSQYACGSNADRYSAQNEIVCFLLDGSVNRLVVAPVMTDLNAGGGGNLDYNKVPKGNLDITGKYFIWTSNFGSNRLDAFIVKVPEEVLYGAPPILPQNPPKPGRGHGKPR